MKTALHAWSLIVLGFFFCMNASRADDTVYAGLIDPACMMHYMVSKDSGATWTEYNTPLGWMEIHAIAPAVDALGKVYITQGSAIYYSTDFGLNWSNNIFTYNVSYLHDIEIDPLHPEWLWTTSNIKSNTVGVFLSKDSGGTWEEAGDGLPYHSGKADVAYCIAIGTGSPRVAYVGTWDAIAGTTLGVYKRDISSSTNPWQYSGLIGEGPVKDIAVDPVDQDLCFAATGFTSSSIGAIWRTIDGGGSWDKVLDAGSTGGTIDWDFEYSNGTLYVPVFAKGMYISTDKGDTWECYSTGLAPGVSCVSVSPRVSSVVYAGCQPSTGSPSDSFYKSTDEGQTWFKAGSPPYLLWCVLIKAHDASLWADINCISCSQGGVVNFGLNAGIGNGNRPYLLLGSVSGTYPGTSLPGGAVLPINWDGFTNLILVNLGSPCFLNFMGSLGASGRAQAALDTFGPVDPSLAGVYMHFAYMLAPQPYFTSKPVMVVLEP